MEKRRREISPAAAENPHFKQQFDSVMISVYSNDFPEPKTHPDEDALRTPSRMSGCAFSPKPYQNPVQRLYKVVCEFQDHFSLRPPRFSRLLNYTVSVA